MIAFDNFKEDCKKIGELGYLMRKMREDQSLTTKYVADKLYVSEQLVYAWENGTRLASYNHLSDFTRLMKCDRIETILLEKAFICALAERKGMSIYD